jgi:hypothetical protein
MTRLDLTLRFAYKARAWDAACEQAADFGDRRSRYTRLTLFDIHAMLLLASRGEGAVITAADTHIERRQFMRSAETAKAELNDLAKRGYLEKVGNGYRLAEKGVEFLNITVS